MDYNNSSKFPDNSEVGRRSAGNERSRNGPRKASYRDPSYRERDPRRSFFADDPRNVAERMFWEGFIPGLKRLALGFLGEWWGADRGYSSGGSYRDYSSRGSRPVPIDRDRVDRESYRPSRRVEDEWNEFVYDSREEALHYLYELEDCIRVNGAVSIPKFYQLIGYKGGSYAVERYGWKNLDNVKIYYDDREDGFKMRFPDPILLERRW